MDAPFDSHVTSLAFLARLLIGGFFAAGGIEHFVSFRPAVEEVRLKGITQPEAFLVSGSCWQVAAGLALIFDAWRPWPAVALIAFTALASVTMLDFWNAEEPLRTGLRRALTTNVALIGGLLLMALPLVPV